MFFECVCETSLETYCLVSVLGHTRNYQVPRCIQLYQLIDKKSRYVDNSTKDQASFLQHSTPALHQNFSGKEQEMGSGWCLKL